ncbi:MAG: GreA/GreB family elongation factor [Candidatus Staskawiczbacteria bacterium]|jgi:transcription elongation factor GreA
MVGKVFYITKKKLEELQAEHKTLLDLELRKTKTDAPKIFQSEDVNPEYINFQEDLGFLRSRINELEDILKNFEIIKKPQKTKQSVVGLGSKITVSVEGEKDEFTIVGTLEANPSLGKISNESPVGSAMMDHKVGDVVIVSSPIKVAYKILKIDYHTS